MCSLFRAHWPVQPGANGPSRIDADAWKPGDDADPRGAGKCPVCPPEPSADEVDEWPKPERCRDNESVLQEW